MQLNTVVDCSRNRPYKVGYGLDDWISAVRFPVGAGKFVSRPALGPTQPPIYWVTGSLSPVVKRLGREAD